MSDTFNFQSRQFAVAWPNWQLLTLHMPIFAKLFLLKFEVTLKIDQYSNNPELNCRQKCARFLTKKTDIGLIFYNFTRIASAWRSDWTCPNGYHPFFARLHSTDQP